MVLVSAVLKWWQPEYVLVSWAVLGEGLEFALGAAGSPHAGGSTQGAALAIVSGLVDTALRVPIIGTVIGACLGAFIGSLIGDLWAGRPLFPSFAAGWRAAVGRFWWTISKLTTGALIVVLLALAACF
jgi:hypothetical protein